MTLGDCGGNTLLVICAIGGERGHGSHDLIEQGASLGIIIDFLRGQRRSHDLSGVGIQASVELTPGPTRLGAVLLDQLLAGGTEFEARAVHQQVQWLAATARPWPWHL